MFNPIAQTSKHSKQPKDVKISLKPHQLSMIYSMNELETSDCDNSDYNVKSNVGILADNVGSGKTLTVLGLISSNKTLTDFKIIPQCFNSMIAVQYKKNKTKISVDTNIIVVPHTILTQWEDTIKNQTNLKYLTLYKKKQVDKFITDISNVSNNDINVPIQDIFQTREEEYNYDVKCTSLKVKHIMDQYDIILISATQYNRVCNYRFSIYTNVIVSRVIFDEADTIKISNCCKPSSKFTWFVSSSYNNIIYPNGLFYWLNNDTNEATTYVNYSDRVNFQRLKIEGINHTGFIKDTGKILNTVLGNFPNIVNSIILRNDDNYVQSSFRLEEPSDNYILCEYPYNMNIIKDVISGEVLSMLNAGNVIGAIEKLSCTKVNNEDNLVKLVTEDLERELHNTHLELEMKRQQHYNNEQTKQQAIQKLVEKEANLKQKISHIKSKLVENANCPICYDTVNNKIILKCCNTAYCLECITIWLSMNNSNSCPFCRSTVSMNDAIIVNSECKQMCKKINVIKDKNYHVKLYLEKLSKKPNFKLLIFSDYYESFTIISEILNDLNITSSMIKGTTSSINNTIRSYKSNGPDSINVLMLNSQYCGSGINLENTTDVLIFHYMNKSKDSQIIGRAQRPGRTSKLNIMRLCYENEIQSVSSISNRVDV